MNNPWDRPPYPKRGSAQRVLFESVGRALMAWEEIEGSLAHLHSTFRTGWPFDVNENREYGEPQNFVGRLETLKQAACQYFHKNPSQEREAAFDEIVTLFLNWSPRRNDVAHGRARFMHWVLDPNSPETLLSAPGPLKWCLIPPHFKGEKFTPDEKPTYILTSREMNRFSEAFWAIARQANDLMHKVEAPSPASFGRSVLPHA
jgi:hypothetical protein